MAKAQECDWGYSPIPDESAADHWEEGRDGHSMYSSVAWVPLAPGARRGVLVIFQQDYYFHNVNGGVGLYEFPAPAGINFAPSPRVWSTGPRHDVAAACCGLGGGVIADLVDGSTVFLPAHTRTSLKLGLPALKPSYPAVPLSEAVGEGVVEAGNYRLVPLYASGVLCHSGDPAKILWSDAGGRPRGWEVYEPGALQTPRFAVAGQQLMFSGRSPKGFTSAPITVASASTVANFAYHATVAKF